MARDTHRVMKHPDGGWQLKRDGAQRATLKGDTQKELIESGREISRNQETEFQIHGTNGRIRQSDSHGNDPYPPKG
jgi:hypothetical protein